MSRHDLMKAVWGYSSAVITRTVDTHIGELACASTSRATPNDLLAARDLDVAFVSPWLPGVAKTRGARIDAKRVVVYHHEDGETVPPYQDRHVPR